MASERRDGRRRSAPLPRWLRLGLGGLWLLDALAQAQPGMFGMAMLGDVMQPSAQGNPAWAAGMVDWAMRVVTPHVAVWNGAFIAVQLAIAAALLAGRADWNRAGLWLSIGWSGCVWVFGEGLGGVLTGSASLITGAPGSAALYGLIAALALLGWGRGRRRPLAYSRPALVLLFGLAAIAQAAPVLRTPLGLSSLFQSALMMQPPWLAATMAPVVQLTARQPLVWDTGFVLLMAAIAVGVAGRRPWALPLAAGWLLFVWWFGQGLGMLATGMGTDPNTAPLIALLLLADWQARRLASGSVRQGGEPYRPTAA